MTEFESDIVSQRNIQDMLKPLKEAKEETEELKAENNDLIAKVTELEDQENKLILEKNEITQLLEIEQQECSNLKEKISENKSQIETLKMQNEQHV